MYTDAFKTTDIMPSREGTYAIAQPASSQTDDDAKRTLPHQLDAVARSFGVDIVFTKDIAPAYQKPPLRHLTKARNVKGLHWFDDTYKHARRLNFLGHVWVDGDGNGKMRVHINDKYYAIDGNRLKELYYLQNKKNVNYFYKYIRIISSHSAEGTHPFGRQVAHAFGLETKAFLGFVNTIQPETMEKQNFNKDFISRNYPENDLNRLLKTGHFTLIAKDYPKTPHKLAKWTGYNPIKFAPHHQESPHPSQPDTVQAQ